MALLLLLLLRVPSDKEVPRSRRRVREVHVVRPRAGHHHRRDHVAHRLGKVVRLDLDDELRLLLLLWLLGMGLGRRRSVRLRSGRTVGLRGRRSVDLGLPLLRSDGCHGRLLRHSKLDSLRLIRTVVRWNPMNLNIGVILWRSRSLVCSLGKDHDSSWRGTATLEEVALLLLLMRMLRLFRDRP
jgi:hypothetical protein